jgi:peptidoglycan/LPS O-acetylase OafA/YrhL
VLRIVPLMYGTLALFLLILPRVVALPEEITRTYVYQGWLWAFLSNWVQSSGMTVYWFSHFWSLAVEEQFYLVWPMLAARTSDRRFAALCVAIIIAAILSRILMLAADVSNQAIYNFTNSRMDALAIGALVAVALRAPAYVAAAHAAGRGILWLGVGTLAALAVVTNGFALHSAWLVIPGYTILAMVFAGLIVVSCAGGHGRAVARFRAALSWAPLRSVGRYSYAMYVFHQPLALGLNTPLLRLLKPTGAAAPVLFGLAIVVASYAAGFVSYFVLERNVLRLKRYFPQ